MIEDPQNVKLNEQPEPSAGNAQVSLGVTVVLILLSYVGCYKVDKLNANFAASVHGPFGSEEEVRSLAPSAEEIMLSKGEKDFKSVCAACHGPTGTGGAQGPALAQSEWVNVCTRRRRGADTSWFSLPCAAQHAAALRFSRGAGARRTAL